jgi:hypothetical protein
MKISALRKIVSLVGKKSNGIVRGGVVGNSQWTTEYNVNYVFICCSLESSKLRRVEQGSKRGNQQGEKIARGMYGVHMNLFSPRVYNRMFAVIE